MSAKLGWWSVGLALGAFVLYWVLGLTLLYFAMETQSWKDPTENAQYTAASIVTQVLLGAILVVAFVLGIRSIVRGSRHRGRAGRAAAIVLGSIGAVLSLPMVLYLLLPYTL